MEEIWKDIIGYEGRYQVSDLGNVKSLGSIYTRFITLNGKKYLGNFTRKGKLLKKTINNSGYYVVGFRKDIHINKVTQYKVHRLVCCTFNNIEVKGEKYGKKDVKGFVCHKDDIKTNNKLENLYLGTPKDNMVDKYRNGKQDGKKGEDNYFSKLKKDDVIYIRNIKNMNTVIKKELSEKYKVHIYTIERILNNKTRKNV